MSSNLWEEFSLEQLTSYVSRGISPLYTDIIDNGTTVLNQKCIRGNRVSFVESRLTNTLMKKLPHDKIIQNFDILVNSTGVGTLGRVAQIKNIEGTITADSHITIVRPNEKVYPLYLGYSLILQQSKIESLAEGSTGQTELSRKRLSEEIHVKLPSLIDQKVIADTLSCLDDKIEINNRINKNLEEMAQAIFKSWFVDFEPFQDREFEDSELGRIPKGWKIINVGAMDCIVTDYVANGSFASLKENVTLYNEENYAFFMRNVDLKVNIFNKYVDKRSYDFLSKTQLFGNELIISNVGDVGSVFLCPTLTKPMVLGNNIIMVNSKKDNYYNYYLYLLFKYFYGVELINSITGGSAQPKFNKTDFRRLNIILPPHEKLDEFNNLVDSIFKMKNLNVTENTKLSFYRDLILPKLMNGEIRIPIQGE